MNDFLDAPFPAIRGQAPDLIPIIEDIDFLDAPFPAFRGQAPDLIPRIVDIPEEEIVIPQDGRLMHLRGLGAAELRIYLPVVRSPGEYLMRRQAPFERLPVDWEEFSGINYLGLQQHLQEELVAHEQVEDTDDEEEEFPDDDDLGLQLHLPEELEAPEAPEQVEDTDDEEEEFPENDDLGVQQHRPEDLEAPEQVEDMDNEEEEFSENDDLGVQQHRPEDLEAPEQVEDMDNEEEDLNIEKETMDCMKPSSQDVDAKSSASEHVTKRDESITDDSRLLKVIGSSASSVATIGLQDSAMPGASSPAFVPILESATTSETLTSDQVDGLDA